MNLRNMTTDQLLERRTAIACELDRPDADLDALEEEVRAINEELERRRSDEQRRAELRSAVSGGGVNVDTVHTFPAQGRQAEPQDAVYRRAWLKNLAVRQGTPLFGELTTEERAAFVATTGNTGAVVPPAVLNRITELVESMSPMYDDAAKTNMLQGFSVPRHKATAQGDAAGVAEGAANVDEKDTFDLLTLDGIEIKKHVVLSRKMKFKSIEAFESWLVQHIAQRIAVAKEKVILARLDGKAPDGGSVIANSGIAAANILTGQAYTDAAIRAIFGKLKGQGARVVYANSATIWNHLAGIEDGMKQKLFVPNSMGDPIVQGRIYGATIKVDNNLDDNVVYFGTVGQVLANDYEDLFVFSAVEPKTANDIKTGYSLFDAGLENPESFVKATFQVSA